ncbi:MAG: phenylalanine--tRNA ligase subunit alpha [Mycoplasmoidaceae bacterium]
MMIDRSIIDNLKLFVKSIDNEKKLSEEKNIFNKKHIAPIYGQIKDKSLEEKKDFGKKINDLKVEVDNIFDNQLKIIKEKYINSLRSEFDPLLDVNDLLLGGINPIDASINLINNFFKVLNFEVVSGTEISLTKYNFDNLNMDENHAARDEHDTFFIDKNIVLRTHCTSVSAEIIENNKNDEIKVISYGNVYRKDEDDATHSHQFNQLDIIWIRRDLNVSNLKWLINNFLKYFFNNYNIKTKYRLSYFPFTEPSFEVDMSCFKCDGKGCNICKETGWIEVLGSGIFNPKVIYKANLSEDMIGLAAGIGIDRLTMLKYGINDIRYLYSNDFRILSKFKGEK